ncbi:MAG TPA: beta-ketoacyl synthase N-terminal-like domain-containing protein, partial [Labilithrix sp.]|nr:beta-ketoacyl synthase N-terminal-like domain-containing protein [Labilithrix sp.]
MRVICTRSRMVEERIAGKAAIVEMAPDEARAFLVGREDRVWVAGTNGPSATLLAGDAAALGEVLADVERQHRGGRYVKDLLPTHTPCVDAIAAELASALVNVSPRRATVPMVSTVTANAVEGPELDGAYWVRNLREPFVFSKVIETLLRADCDVFLEVSPHPVQIAPILDLIALADRQAIAIGSLRRNEPERRAMLRSLGGLHVSSCDVAWAHLFPQGATLAELPTYPWKLESHWWSHPGEGEPVSERGERSVPARRVEAPSRKTAEDRESTFDRVRGEVAKALGVASADAIDPRRPFRELGLTSLMTMELAVKLGRAFGRPMPSSAFFNYPNVEALASYLAAGRSEGGHASAERRQSVRPIARVMNEPIAVVGYGCRLPGGVDSPEAYWELLRRGIDVIREVPANRWAIDRWYDPEPGRPGKMSTKWGGFVDDIDAFDASFFGISPREAEEMDPQQRMLLEVAWEALERAGQAPDSLSGSKTGVFLGMMNNNDYAARKRLLEGPSRIRGHHGTGIATSIAAGRLAYTLGLSGPAMTVDTACSSSLVAVHLAILSLRRGECRMALAGGVNAILSPELTVAYSQAGMLSPNGRCKTFDASADGYVRSEGCGILVLKPLADAVASGDNVLAVLTGAAVNQDGRSSGLTAPNGHAQRAVIRAALADAGVSPSHVDYLEAHGTGTRLGDPIELEAIGDVFRESRSSDRPVLVGSVKTNLGHLEAAAGVAGLMKVILALRHEEIPPHLHFERLNPQVSTDAMSPLGIPTERTPWV